jgi:hypothetical protein
MIALAAVGEEDPSWLVEGSGGCTVIGIFCEGEWTGYTFRVPMSIKTR